MYPEHYFISMAAENLTETVEITQ